MRQFYANTVHLKHELGTRLPEFEIDTIDGHGDLSPRFSMSTFNRKEEVQDQFIIGEKMTVMIEQMQEIRDLNFYIEACVISVSNSQICLFVTISFRPLTHSNALPI